MVIASSIPLNYLIQSLNMESILLPGRGQNPVYLIANEQCYFIFSLQKTTPDELDSCDYMVVTSDEPWDPNYVSFETTEDEMN